TLGGSIPMYLFSDILHAPVVGVPIANHDNDQHAANENLRLQNLWDGIEVYAALIAGLGGAWGPEAGRGRPRSSRPSVSGFAPSRRRMRPRSSASRARVKSPIPPRGSRTPTASG